MNRPTLNPLGMSKDPTLYELREELYQQFARNRPAEDFHHDAYVWQTAWNAYGLQVEHDMKMLCSEVMGEYPKDDERYLRAQRIGMKVFPNEDWS